MGLTLTPGSKIYLDTNIFIYSLEDFAEYQTQIDQLFRRIEENQCVVVTSELTLAECLIKPYKDRNMDSVEMYEQHLQNSEYLKIVPVHRGILHAAASNRASSTNALPDAIHMATAVNTCCDYFVTNDKRISPVDNVELILFS